MLKSRLPTIARSLDPAVNNGLEAGAHLISRAAKQRAPDAPPLGKGLVEAIHVEAADEGDGYYVVAGNDDVFYGHMVENGTVHGAPRPFLIPALAANADQAVGMVRAAIRSVT
jgi:HK97 gp10 family phage protein